MNEKCKATLDLLAVDPSEENLSNLLSNGSCEEFVHHYDKFIEEAYDGKLGTTAQFWLKYKERVWLMLRFLTATN